MIIVAHLILRSQFQPLRNHCFSCPKFMSSSILAPLRTCCQPLYPRWNSPQGSLLVSSMITFSWTRTSFSARMLLLLLFYFGQIHNNTSKFGPLRLGEGSHGSVSRLGLEYNNLFKEFKSVNINYEMGTMLLKCFWGNDLGHFFDRFPQKLVLHTY